MHVRIADRRMEQARAVLHRIDHRDVVPAVFGLAEHRAIAVDGGIALVGRDQVVQVMLLVRPVPGGHHDVAFHALRALRGLARQLALGDAVGPIGQIGERRGAELAGQDVHHLLAGLAGLDAANPCILGGRPEYRRDRARRQRSHLMAADAAIVLHPPDPVDLGDLVGNIVLGAELARIRDPQHRPPVDGRIVLRGSGRARRDHRGQVELLARLARDLGRIDQAIAAHPDLVFGLGQLRQQVTALVVGDHDLGEAGGQVLGFRNHPYPCFRPVRAGDDTADDAVGDGSRRRRLRLQLRGRTSQGQYERDRCCAQVQSSIDPHVTFSWLEMKSVGEDAICCPWYRQAHGRPDQAQHGQPRPITGRFAPAAQVAMTTGTRVGRRSGPLRKPEARAVRIKRNGAC